MNALSSRPAKSARDHAGSSISSGTCRQNGDGGLARYSTKVRMPKDEEAIPVRVTDLKHLKRDINAIPDGQGKFDNAFWGFLGLGAPFILQYAIQPDSGNRATLYLGCVLVVVAAVFKGFGRKARNERSASIRRIMENINDCANGELADDEEPGTFREELKAAVLSRIRRPESQGFQENHERPRQLEQQRPRIPTAR